MKLTESYEEKERKTLYFIGLAFLGAAILYKLIHVFTGFSLEPFLLPCLFYTFTGFRCPGCGGTRAFKCLLAGDIVASVTYHPIVLYGAVLFLWFMISNTIEFLSKGKYRVGMRYHGWYVTVGIVILVLNFIIQNIFILYNRFF